MSVWEQRRKERETTKPAVQPQKITEFAAPKQSEAPTKAMPRQVVEPEKPAHVNVVKSSVIENLTAESELQDEYGGPRQFDEPEIMDFEEFHEQGGMAGIKQPDEPYEGEMRDLNGENSEMPAKFSPESRAEVEMANYERSAKQFEIGAAQQQPQTYYNRDVPQESSEPTPVALNRSKKPSEMTEPEYQEYEREREEKSMELLIRKVLYDKSVSTFDEEECSELLKVDKAFGAMYEKESLRKELAENDAKRRSDDLRVEQESQEVAEQPMIPMEQTSYQRGSTIQGVSEGDLYGEIQHLVRENKNLEERLHAAEYQIGDYEREIGELQNQITDERQQRIQANKNFELAERDMNMLKSEMQSLKSNYEELHNLKIEEEKLDGAIRLAEQTYKPSSPGKPSMVDQLMMNCNSVLERYANLEDTMRNSTVGEEMYFKNNTGTIKVDEESPIRAIGIKQQSVKNSLRDIEGEGYVPSCLTDELDGDNGLTSMLPKSRFGSRPSSEKQ